MHARHAPGPGLCNNLAVRAAVLVVLAAVCFGSTGTAVALGAPDASSSSVGAARVVVGGGLLALLAGRALVAALRRARAGAWGLVAVGALGVVAYQPLFFAGTAANGVAVGTVVALGSAPLVTGVLGWALSRTVPGRRWTLATGVAVVGLVLLASASGGADAGGTSPAGLLASLGAGTSYAVFALVTKALLDRGWTAATSTGAVFGGAAVLSLPVLLATDLAWLDAPAPWAAVLWLGAVTTALAYALFARGLRHLPAATVATLTLAEPLTATLLGLVVLHEHLGPAQVGALLLLAGALAVLAAPARRRLGAATAVPS